LFAVQLDKTTPSNAHLYVRSVHERGTDGKSFHCSQESYSNRPSRQAEDLLEKGHSEPGCVGGKPSPAAEVLGGQRVFGPLVNERESILATLEILADRELTDRLLTLSKSIDDDVAAGRLLTTTDVFGK
jgi:hypothetical protein